MKKPTIVYITLGLLALTIVRVSWAAAHFPRNPKYLIGGREMIAICAAITVAFFFKPLAMRWIVAPFFILSSIATFSRLSQYPEWNWLIVINLVYSFLYLYAGVMLFRIKKAPNQSPEPMPMAVTPPATQEPRQP